MNVPAQRDDRQTPPPTNRFQSAAVRRTGNIGKIGEDRRFAFGPSALADGQPPLQTPLVFVVDDDVSVCDALERLILAEGLRPLTFASARDFLDRPRLCAPSCLILEVNLPDASGLDVQQQIAVDRPELPIIFITGCGDIEMTVRAMKAGAVEFLTKPLENDAVLGAIRQAIDYSQTVLRGEAELQALRNCYATLSYREREVMELLDAGLMNKQVGGELGISEVTVKAHRGKVMEKMKARSLAQLVKMNVRLRLAAVNQGPTLRSLNLIW
jgi:FixJ family two-component response regulator